MAVFGQSYSFRDDKGQTSAVKMWIIADDQATAEPLATDIASALSALSNAAFQSARGAYTSVPSTNSYGTNAEYERIEDKAVMTFETGNGSLHRYKVPAPKAAIFLADGETVDSANGLVTAFVTAMLAAAGSRDENALAAFVGGFRDSVRLQRKFNIFTRSPLLTGPGL